MAGLNILTYLTAYLDECGRSGGKPLNGPALERFLPWNANPEDLRTWAQPPPSGLKPRGEHHHRRGHREPPRRPSACPLLPSHRTSEDLRPAARARESVSTAGRNVPPASSPRTHMPRRVKARNCRVQGVGVRPGRTTPTGRSDAGTTLWLRTRPVLLAPRGLDGHRQRERPANDPSEGPGPSLRDDPPRWDPH